MSVEVSAIAKLHTLTPQHRQAVLDHLVWLNVNRDMSCTLDAINCVLR
ncbi:MAG: hypothetical protein VKJ46_13160 [Leptolyngbyaceae bacterium]|nr:hypothetical protein [Leptolyngbyaceae bacterium]